MSTLTRRTGGGITHYQPEDRPRGLRARQWCWILCGVVNLWILVGLVAFELLLAEGAIQEASSAAVAACFLIGNYVVARVLHEVLA